MRGQIPIEGTRKKKQSPLLGRNKYLEDYAIAEELDGKGRVVKRAYYNGTYYAADWPEDAYKKKKLTAIALSLVVAAGNIYPLAVRHDAMNTMWVILGFVLGLVSFVYMLLASFRLPRDSRPMETEKKDMSFEKLGFWSVLALAGDAFASAASLVFIIITKEKQYASADAAMLVSALIAAAAAFFVRRIVGSASVHETDKESEWAVKQREMFAEAERASETGDVTETADEPAALPPDNE